jgi:enoyl-CoA hydratase
VTPPVRWHGGLAEVRLDCGKGNALNPSSLRAIGDALAEAARGGARAVVLTGYDRFFSTGLDLVSLYELDPASLDAFVRDFDRVMLEVFGFPRPVVAAVNGHAVAGGCILALCADYRILRRGAQIGLNEVKVGVPLPRSIAILLKASAPPPALARIALLGRNFADEEAIAAGLADELADPTSLEEACRARLAEFVEKDAQALATTKRYLRGPVLEAMRDGEREAIADWLDSWFSEATQARIRQTVESLVKR